MENGVVLWENHRKMVDWLGMGLPSGKPTKNGWEKLPCSIAMFVITSGIPYGKWWFYGKTIGNWWTGLEWLNPLANQQKNGLENHNFEWENCHVQ